MSEFDLLSLAADGMRVQRTVLDVAARNVAAAQASTPAHAYPRLVARFAAPQGTALPDGIPEPGAWDEIGTNDGSAGLDLNPGGGGADDPGGDQRGGTRYLGTMRSGESADALTEMIAVLDAQRAYEANASIFDVGKRLAERTLTVGQS